MRLKYVLSSRHSLAAAPEGAIPEASTQAATLLALSKHAALVQVAGGEAFLPAAAPTVTAAGHAATYQPDVERNDQGLHPLTVIWMLNAPGNLPVAPSGAADERVVLRIFASATLRSQLG